MRAPIRGARVASAHAHVGSALAAEASRGFLTAGASFLLQTFLACLAREHDRAAASQIWRCSKGHPVSPRSRGDGMGGGALIVVRSPKVMTRRGRRASGADLIRKK